MVIELSSLTLNRYISNIDPIKRESGDLSYPIWLLVDPKYPAVRHKIWTPVLAEIQEKVYRELHKRIEAKNIYVRYAVSDKKLVPNTLNWWSKEVVREIEIFRELVQKYCPIMLISFGAFPYEFGRRVYDIKPEKGPLYWETTILGDEFGKAIASFEANKTNRIPLLRRVTSSGKFIEDYSYFGDNYFSFVGTKIAEKIIENSDKFNIWID